MKRPEQQHFIASVGDDYMDRIEEVADRLRNKGCKISQVLKLTGIITGRISIDAALDGLRVEGIASVEKLRHVKKK